MRYVLTMTILLIASPAAAEVVRWSDGENVALVDDDGNQFRWVAIASEINRQTPYVGSTDWVDMEPRNNHVRMNWQREELSPLSVEDGNGLNT